MLYILLQQICSFMKISLSKIGFKVKSGSEGEIMIFLWNMDFNFTQSFKNTWWSMINPINILALHFEFAGTNVAMVVAIFGPNFGASWANITPSVQLQALYLAKMVFIKIEIYCAGKKISTSLKHLGHCLFFPFQGINVNIE